MNPERVNEYDEVPYPSQVFPYSHPDNLATIATLYGMHPAPATRCRHLELGCGSGRNLITLALAYPESEFVGIELAREPVTLARAEIEEIGLRNITILHGNLLEAPADLGPFDYVSAHGVYSWVPLAVRDRMMSLCADFLTPQGVAYISYHTYPGCHSSKMVWEMMRHHVRVLEDPEQRTAQARDFLGFLVRSRTTPELYQQTLEKELKRVDRYSDETLYHDDLSPVNDPVYFHEFVEHAARHRLQYLGDARIHALHGEGYTPETLETMEQLEGNLEAWEQYCDFLSGRRFRWSLLCREEVEIDREIRPERLSALSISPAVTPASKEPSLAPGVTEAFVRPDQAAIRTAEPLVKAALFHLHQARPEPVTFPDLLTACRALLKRAPETLEADTAALAETITRTFNVRFVWLRTSIPDFARKAGERPTASPIARRQASETNIVQTLRIGLIEFHDPVSLRLLQLLDGTRDRAALIHELSAEVSSGSLKMHRENRTLPAEEALRLILAELDSTLDYFARSALLIS